MFFVGVVLMGFVLFYFFLVVGSVIVGVGVGYFFMIVLVYIIEFLLVMSWGFFMLLFEFFIILGILFGYLFNYILVGFFNCMNWSMMVGMVGVLVVVICLGVLVMFEFFSWFVMKVWYGEVKKII